jgi:hypothetical protein
VLALLAYVAAAVPKAWFPAAEPLRWQPRDMTVSRGTATIDDGALVVVPDATGAAIVSLTTSFRSSEYWVVAWHAADVPEQARFRLLWRSDYAPARLNAVAIETASGQLRPVSLVREPNWIGTITGVALAIQGASPGQPVRIAAASASPMGARDVLRQRLGEWLTFERWRGTSINTVVGGADAQDLPLPALLALAAVLAPLACAAVLYRRRHMEALPLVIAVVFLAAWSVADARWVFNLFRQAQDTTMQYGGKDLAGKHLAADDGSLFAFILRVRAKLPPEPARIFVAADAHYFRGRAAYHLYPHNVYFEPYLDTIPAPQWMRPGDYIVVYQRHGIQFDAVEGRLRWDGNAPVAAELLHVERGAALFRLK